MAMSVITRGELARGFALRERWLALCEGILVLGLDDAVLWTAAEIFRALRSEGEGIGENDLWIAATALQAQLPLVTENRRPFARIPNLVVLSHRDWARPTPRKGYRQRKRCVPG